MYVIPTFLFIIQKKDISTTTMVGRPRKAKTDAEASVARSMAEPTSEISL